jgi:hypothetical protein
MSATLTNHFRLRPQLEIGDRDAKLARVPDVPDCFAVPTDNLVRNPG